MEEKKHYPLNWPAGWKRELNPRASKFGNYTIDQATQNLIAELKRLKVYSDFIISTNLKYRKDDGLPYSKQAQPADKGVAVYFNLPDDTGKEREMVVACDSFTRIECNIHAIALTIEALRAIERYGSSQLLQMAFSGFKAIAQYATAPAWNTVLELPEDSTPELITTQYKALAMRYHPDRPTGNADKFVSIQRAYEDARRIKNF